MSDCHGRAFGAIAGAGVIGLAIAASALPLVGNADESHAGNQTYAARGYKSANPPPTAPAAKVRTIPDPKPESLQNKSEPRADKEYGPFGLNAEWWTAIFTGVLTLATVGLWLETRCTILHARRASEHELRAYVFLHNTEMEMTTGEAPWPTGKVEFGYRNSGKTPAKKVEVAYRIVRIQCGTLVDFTQWGDFRPVGPLGPNDELSDDAFPEEWPDKCDPRDLTADGSWEIHLFGCIKYADEFSEDRWTKFHSYIGGDVGWDETLHTYPSGNDYK